MMTMGWAAAAAAAATAAAAAAAASNVSDLHGPQIMNGLLSSCLLTS